MLSSSALLFALITSAMLGLFLLIMFLSRAHHGRRANPLLTLAQSEAPRLLAAMDGKNQLSLLLAPFQRRKAEISRGKEFTTITFLHGELGNVLARLGASIQPVQNPYSNVSSPSYIYDYELIYRAALSTSLPQGVVLTTHPTITLPLKHAPPFPSRAPQAHYADIVMQKECCEVAYLIDAQHRLIARASLRAMLSLLSPQTGRQTLTKLLHRDTFKGSVLRSLTLDSRQCSASYLGHSSEFEESSEIQGHVTFQIQHFTRLAAALKGSPSSLTARAQDLLSSGRGELIEDDLLDEVASICIAILLLDQGGVTQTDLSSLQEIRSLLLEETYRWHYSIFIEHMSAPLLESFALDQTLEMLAKTCEDSLAYIALARLPLIEALSLHTIPISLRLARFEMARAQRLLSAALLAKVKQEEQLTYLTKLLEYHDDETIWAQHHTESTRVMLSSLDEDTHLMLFMQLDSLYPHSPARAHLLLAYQELFAQQPDTLPLFWSVRLLENSPAQHNDPDAWRRLLAHTTPRRLEEWLKETHEEPNPLSILLLIHAIITQERPPLELRYRGALQLKIWDDVKRLYLHPGPAYPLDDHILDVVVIQLLDYDVDALRHIKERYHAALDEFFQHVAKVAPRRGILDMLNHLHEHALSDLPSSLQTKLTTHREAHLAALGSKGALSLSTTGDEGKLSLTSKPPDD